MTLNEYEKELKKLNEKHDNELKELAIKFALSNNNVSIGDIVTDHIGSIKVDIIRFHLAETPSCVYCGIQHTKTGKPFKNKERRRVYQTNLIYHIRSNERQ